MSQLTLRDLIRGIQDGSTSRRDFMAGAAALGISAVTAQAMASTALAQSPEASPATSPAASPVSGEAVKSITRDEYNAALKAALKPTDIGNPGGNLIYGETSDLSTMSPILVSDTYSGIFTGFIFNYLCGSSALDGTVVPDLADYWVLEPDGVTYTFYLNKDAKFHDGTPVTAKDVKFSYDVTLDEKSLSVRKSSVEAVLKESKIVDDYTFQLIAKEKYATFLYETAQLVGIIPQHIWKDVPADQYATDPGATGQDPARVIGSGAFKFKEWKLGETATMVKNPDYFDKDFIPNIDSFTYQVIGDATSLVSALKTGAIDICGVPFTSAKELESNPDLQIHSYDTAAQNWFNMMQDPARSQLFVDPKVRQALMYGLDRDLIAETIYLGYAVRADGMQPVLSIAYQPEKLNTIYKHDVEKAKSLLKEAGWSDSDGDGIVDKDGKKFSFECYYSEGSAIYEQQIPYMQQAWREIGIEMIPTAIPFPTLSEMGDTGNYEMRVYGFSWGFEGTLGTMYKSSSVPPAGFNSMHYSNAEYDRLEELQLKELDPEKRLEILAEQNNILNDDVAAGVVVFRKSAVGNRATVHNYFPSGYGSMWSIPWVWLDPQ